MAQTAHLCRAYNLMTLRKKGLPCLKSIIIRGFCSENGEFIKSSGTSVLRSATVSKSNFLSSNFRQIERKVLSAQNSLNLLSGESTFKPVKNFSTSKPIRLFFQPSNQNKEKFSNYVVFGITVVVIAFVSYMNLTMRYHEDYVYVDSDESEDK